MSFFCNSCEIVQDFDRDYGLLIITPKDGIKRICRLCRTPKAGIPDVYFDGKPEENLADDPRTNKPRVFASKGEKAEYLKSRGLREAGDTYHGAPISTASAPPRQNTRPQVQEALRQVKNMGRDYRRQEYLRIVKEGQRHAER